MISVYTYTSSLGQIQPSSPALSPPNLDLHSKRPHPHSAEGQSDRQSGTTGKIIEKIFEKNIGSQTKYWDPKTTNITMRYIYAYLNCVYCMCFEPQQVYPSPFDLKLFPWHSPSVAPSSLYLCQGYKPTQRPDQNGKLRKNRL